MEGDRNQRRLASSDSLKESASSKAEGEPDALAAAGSSASRRAPSNEGMEGKGTLRRETSEESASSNASPKYTKEQEEVVQTILKCKDHYEVLGLQKCCTADEVQRAYRKLALKVHPDKNHAPGATEAFKSMNNASNILTDPEERRRYDSQPSSQSYQQQAAQNQQQAANLLMALLAGIGVVAAVGWFLDWLLGRGPAYNLQQNEKYVIRRTTERLSVWYFVERDFLRYHGDNITQIEQQVEAEFLRNLLHDCSTTGFR